MRNCIEGREKETMKLRMGNVPSRYSIECRQDLRGVQRQHWAMVDVQFDEVVHAYLLHELPRLHESGVLHLRDHIRDLLLAWVEAHSARQGRNLSHRNLASDSPLLHGALSLCAQLAVVEVVLNVAMKGTVFASL